MIADDDKYELSAADAQQELLHHARMLIRVAEGMNPLLPPTDVIGSVRVGSSSDSLSGRCNSVSLRNRLGSRKGQSLTSGLPSLPCRHSYSKTRLSTFPSPSCSEIIPNNDHLWHDYYKTGKVTFVPELASDLRDKTTRIKEDAEFWISIVQQKGVSELGHQTDINQQFIDSRIDLTPRRILQIYNRFDADQDGGVSVAEFRLGLQHQGFKMSNDSIDRVIIRLKGEIQIDEDDVEVHISEFSLALQQLKLAELFLPSVCQGTPAWFANFDNKIRKNRDKDQLDNLRERSLRSSIRSVACTDDVSRVVSEGQYYWRTVSVEAERQPDGSWMVSTLDGPELFNCKVNIPGNEFQAHYIRDPEFGLNTYKFEHYVLAIKFDTPFDFHDIDMNFVRGPSGNMLCVDESIGMSFIMNPSEFDFWFEKANRRRVQLSCIDYNTEDVLVRTPVVDVRSGFFFASRPIEFKAAFQGHGVRWVHVEALDKITLLRLAVKYHLHPLAVEDALEVQNQPSKLDRHGYHYFLALNMAHLVAKPIQVTDSDVAPPVKFVRSYFAMFVAGAPLFDTVISFVKYPEESLKYLQATTSEHHIADVWKELRESIDGPHFKVREFLSDFLVFTIIDKCVDGYLPLVAAYRNRLSFFQMSVRHKRSGLPPEQLEEISVIRMELVDLQRIVKPLRRVIIHILNDKDFSGDSTMYLEDVKDHVDTISDDLSQLLEVCKQVVNDYNMLSDRKMNDTLYVLTIASTIFLPAQFITGLYGMNFQDEDGKPTIPELTWKYGYFYFWVTVVVVTIVLVCVVKSVNSR